MKYVSVTSPGSEMSKPIFNYFDDYLVSMGEPTTSKAWTMAQVLQHVNKMLKEKPKDDKIKLYIDSGGFQIIVGYVLESRITEYIDTFHFILNKYHNEIDYIFALDIFALTFLPSERIFIDDKKEFASIPQMPDEYVEQDNIVQKLKSYNTYSMQESINSIIAHPDLSDKLLFIMQTSNIITFNIWEQLFNELKVYEHHKRWSIGGLVGLKKSTNAKFSHAVPATLWLLTQQKAKNFTIDQIHWLGQSSRLSFLSMALFERIYGLNMTSDSSQLVRFAPLDAKLPYLIEHNSNFELVENVSDVKTKMLTKHSIPEQRIYIEVKNGMITEINKAQATVHFKSQNLFKYNAEQYVEITNSILTPLYFLLTPSEYLDLTGRLDNHTFIELQSQNLHADLHFGNLIGDMIMKIGLENITSEQDLRVLHPVMNRGRTAQELYNNIIFFKKFKNIVETGDTSAAKNILIDVVKSYGSSNEPYNFKDS